MKNVTVSPTHDSGRSTRRTGVLAWLRLARVFQKIERRSADRFRDAELSTAQFDVLAHVGAADGPTQQDLATSLLVTKGNICQLLDRMEAGNLLTRRAHGRANRLYLTPEGRQVYDRVVPDHEGFIDGLLSPLSPQEQSELLRLLRKLDHALT